MDPRYWSLEVIDHDRGDDALATARLAVDGEDFVLAFQETCQRGVNPKACEFLSVVGQQRDANSRIAQDRVFRGEPRLDGLDIGD